MGRTIGLAIAAWVAACGVSLAQEPAAYANVIRLGEGEVFRASGQVDRGQSVLRFPFEYRRTGRLVANVRSSGGMIYAAVGAPGFVAAELGYGGGPTRPLWCFPRPRGENDFACFYGAAVFTLENALVVEGVQYRSLTNATSTPGIEEGPVTMPFPLVFEYRFSRWTSDWLVLELFGGGTSMGAYRVARQGDVAILNTVAGAIRFERVGNGARVSAVESPNSSVTPRLAAGGTMTIESALVGERALQPSAEFVAINRETDLFTQTVRSGPGMRQLSTPRGNAERYGAAGAALFPAMRGRFPVLCWQSQPPEFSNWSSTWRAHCLEDPDHDGAYDVMWPYVEFLNPQTFFISSMTFTERLRDPVRVEPAPDASRLTADVSLVYLGPAAERRTDGGALEVSAVEFDWRISGRRVGREFRIPIESGAGVVRLPDGTVFGEIRNVTTSGAAEFMLTGGFATDRVSYLSGRRAE